MISLGLHLHPRDVTAQVSQCSPSAFNGHDHKSYPTEVKDACQVQLQDVIEAVR